MASKDGGISGLALAAAAAGTLLIVAGIKDAPLIDAIREVAGGGGITGRSAQKAGDIVGNALAQGADIASGGQAGAAAGDSSSRAAAIVAAARGWIGVPYRWGGTSREGVDCSGLVYRCLLAAGVPVGRKTSYGYRAWSGAVDIPRAQCAAGDLVCYTGHIAIATSNSTMIHAPRPGKTVTERSIYKGQGGPIIRRVKG